MVKRLLEQRALSDIAPLSSGSEFMTNQTDEYRAKAQHCRQMADQVISPIDKEMWLRLAADWLQMAAFRERSATTERDRETSEH
jgi:hypothetical protein